MPRAYLRLDPAFDERKESYPDGPYAALIATLCLAELQPERGRFRSLDYLSRLLGRRGRHVPYLVEHGDIVLLPDGRPYVEGWDEWQEGDWKVAERVARIRHRKDVTSDVTVDVTSDVTVPVTPLVTAPRLSGAVRSVAVGEAVSGAEPSAPDPWADPEHEAMVWLARHGCDLRPGNGYHQKLVTAVERHGVNSLIGMMDRLAAAGTKNGDIKGFLFGAIDALDARSRPNLAVLEKEERAEAAAESFAERAARTRERTAAIREAIEGAKP
jgi:hypothetical protein